MSPVIALRHSNAAPEWNTSKETGVWDGSKEIRDSFSLHRYQGDNENWGRGGLPTPPSTRAMNGVTVGQQLSNNPTPQAYQAPRFPLHSLPNSNVSTHQRNNSYAHADMQGHSNGSSVGHRPNGSQNWDFSIPKTTTSSIASYLQIPESINKSKGSLAEFAAEITCLFWFETAETLQFAEDMPNASYVDRGLVPDAAPSIGFRKWVTTILSTTQVGKNVILLALMFIYRLKKFNPAVSGKRGSEFRLLTIALMLGNKFLDDNTYTNKTWAEVSGIAVTEIHIMEVEFLSNMRYDLYAKESEWAEWKVKLGKFGAFYDVASKFNSAEEQRPIAPLTPISQSFPHKLPSPPSTHHSAPFYPSPHSSTNNYSTLPNPAATVPHLPKSPNRHYRNPVLEQLERKRSMDFSTELPPAKRMYQPPSNLSSASSVYTPAGSIQTPGSAAAYTPSSSNSVPFSDDGRHGSRVPRLPIPKIQTTTAGMQPSSHLAPISFPSSRAMSIVYPNTSTAWSQPVTPVSTSLPMVPNLYQNPIPSLGDHSRDHSNYASAQASPSYGVATPTRLSPSYFLTNRSSPYRPVRGVNTLLIPPPSASMQNVARNIPSEQMYYQPLSKAAAERRTGPVPYYQPEGWQQSNTSTPVPLQYGYRA